VAGRRRSAVRPTPTGPDRPPRGRSGDVVCGLLLSAFLPMREYLAQRGDIAQLESEQAQARKRVAALEAERDRLQDPAYIAAEARRRLHFVLPGETAYVVLAPEETPTEVEAEGPVGATAPWYSQVWAVSSRLTGPRTRDRSRRQGLTAVGLQLGRVPRAMTSVAHRCRCGLPDVVQTQPRLEDGTPFPTLYYLTCPRLASAIGTLEADGLMKEQTARLGAGRGAAGPLRGGRAGLRVPPRCAGGARRRPRAGRHAGPREVPARARRPQPGRGSRRQPLR
jgi:hypothetical protein